MSTTLPPLEPDRRFVCPSGSRSPRRARGRTRSRLGLRSSVPLLRGRPDVYAISVSSRRRCERADSVETRLDPCGAVRHVEVLPALVVGEASGDALAGESPELIDRQEMQGDRPVAARGGQEPATASGDGTVALHLLPIDELRRLARERVTRGFTDDECRQYLHVANCPAGI